MINIRYTRPNVSRFTQADLIGTPLSSTDRAAQEAIEGVDRSEERRAAAWYDMKERLASGRVTLERSLDAFEFGTDRRFNYGPVRGPVRYIK